ncbi:HPP family protein [Spirillospora sp. NPDC050679]
MTQVGDQRTAEAPWDRAGRRRLPSAAWSVPLAAVCIALPAALAWWLRQPLVFPSLGPTIFLALTSAAEVPACPRNTLLGHLVSAAAGYLALAVTDLTRTPPDLAHPDGRRVLAVAVALALTCAGMAAPRLRHPPGGATTLIVALGLLRTPAQLADLMAAVALTTGLLVLANRSLRRPYPVWAPRDRAPTTADLTRERP